MAKKKRRKPMKRADTPAKIQAQHARYEKLLGTWITKSEQALARVRKYRQKAAYYLQRMDEVRTAQIQQAEEDLGRPLRSVQLDSERPPA